VSGSRTTIRELADRVEEADDAGQDPDFSDVMDPAAICGLLRLLLLENELPLSPVAAVGLNDAVTLLWELRDNAAGDPRAVWDGLGFRKQAVTARAPRPAPTLQADRGQRVVLGY